MQQIDALLKVATAHRDGHQRSGPVIAMQVVKWELEIELTPVLELFGKQRGLQLTDRFAQREGEDVPEPRLSTLG